MKNENLKGRLLRSSVLAGAAISMAVSAAPAYAQDEIEEIFITGSRIARSDFTSESAITVVTGEDLATSGFTSIAEALRQEVGVTSGGFSQSSVLSGGGATSIDLRSLGQARVLVLINGRRVATFADSLQNEAKDLSFLPIAMIERVEILRDGASSTYGADAVTGVVNVILKDDFEGLQLNVLQGVATNDWDGEQTQISAVMGGNFDRGNVVLGVEYRFNDEIWQRDRDWAFPSISSLSAGGFNNGSFFSPGGVYFPNAPVFDDSNPDPDLWDFVIDPGTGDPYVWIDGTCTEPKAFGGDEVTDIYPNCPSFRGGDDRKELARYDYGLGQTLLQQHHIFNTSLSGRYDVTDRMEFFIETEVSKRESMIRLDGNPGIVGVTRNNPYLAPENYDPLQVEEDGDGNIGYFYVRPASTVGKRVTEVDTNMMRAVSGFRGDFDLIGSNWNWEVNYLWTKVDTQLETDGIYNPIRMAKMGDAVACGADDLCAAALTAAGKEAGVDALDITRPGNWLPAEIQYFEQGAFSVSEFETNQFSGFVSGDIYELPAGALGVAIGAEYREDYGRAKPDSITEAGESIANQVYSTRGSFDTAEVFAEINAPLLKDMCLLDELCVFKDLSVNLQGRWFDFSNFGEDTVYKVGLNWAISEDLRARGSIGTSFRAPTIVDLFSGGTDSFDHVDDPCNDWNLSADPNIVANCGPGGANLAPGYTQIASQFRVLHAGNPNLQPETSESRAFGVVITPRSIPNLSLSIDYWEIEMANFIGNVETAEQIITACYEGAVGLADPQCDRFSRSTVDGQVIGLVNGAGNDPDTFETSGIDWGINYVMDLWDGSLSLSNSGSWTDKYGDADAGIIDSNYGSIVDLKTTASATFSKDDWAVTWATRFIGEMEDGDFPADEPNVFNYHGSENQIEHDMRLNYFWDGYALTLGMNNVFDEEPPYIFNSGNNTDTATFGSAVIGRTIFARVVADF